MWIEGECIWNLSESFSVISTRFWDLGEFLAAEILRSRQDLVENLDEISKGISVSFWPPRFQDLAEISPRSQQSRRPKARQDSRRDLSEISPRSWSKFCRGIQKIVPQAKSGKYFQIWFFSRFGGGKMSAFWACACKLSWTLLSPARVQPLYGMGRKESSGTGLLNTVIGFFQVTWGKVHAILRQECWLQSSRGKFVC